MGKDSRSEPQGPPKDATLLTSFHVRRAHSGDRASLEWLVERFSPFLRATAEYRLSKSLQGLYDPDDIVSEVWAVAIPRLASLSPREERFTPVLLKFLSTTLLYTVNNILKKHLRRAPRGARASGDSATGAESPLDRVASPTTGVEARLERREVADQVSEAIQKLDPRDREIIVLRGIEQSSYKDIALVLGEDPKVLAVRFQRALEKLRRALPGSICDEIEA